MTYGDSLIFAYYDFLLKKEKKEDKGNYFVEEPRFEYIKTFEKLKGIEEVHKEFNDRYSSGITEVGKPELGTILKIVRLKDDLRETLRIYIYFSETELLESTKSANYIDCNMLNINTALNELVIRGTGLSKKDVSAIAIVIQNNYRFINVTEDDVKERNLYSIAEMFNNVIEELEKKQEDTVDKERDDKFILDIKSFNDYLDTADTQILSSMEIRKLFKKYNITLCNTGRTDYTLLDEKSKNRYKAICFKKKELKGYLVQFKKYKA